MKLYCPTCGGATNYSLEKPKFCASCGESFTVSASTTPRRITKVRPEKAFVEIEEEQEEIFEAPEINKLQYDLNSSDKNFNITPLNQLAGTNQGGEGDGYTREADPTYTAESFAEDFRKDAGSSRRADAET